MTTYPDDGAAFDRAAERALVRRILADDGRAVDEFVQRFVPRLLRLLRSRMRQQADVDDVLQAVLVIAVRKIDSWRGEASLHTWLAAIARHELGRQYGAEQRRLNRFVSADGDLLEQLAASAGELGDDPEAAVRSEQLRTLVHMALDALPERYARVLELKYMEGWSSQEIAQELGMSDVSAQSLLARARRALRAGLEQSMPDLELMDDH